MPVSKRLSTEAAALKNLCDSTAEAVSFSIKDMIGDPTSGHVLKMGADGTPTKDIDKRAEETVLSSLESSGIGFTVLSEEMGKKVIGENPQYFIHLDPLDGTFNAINGIPLYSVSIYISNKTCKFGYVFDLVQRIKYYAEEGNGAWTEIKSGEPRCLRVSTTKSLTDFSISAYTIRPRTRKIVMLADVVRRIRTLGSISLELCLVACGKLDAFADLRGGLRTVDVAAGNLIVKEAGGLVTDEHGKKIHIDDGMWQKRNLVISNGLAHQKILDLVGGDEI
ncbi:MAG: bifunctional fructose-bisphosphatase/inositol-phosphate phosphatase [Methanotrichaceae archaeon]